MCHRTLENATFRYIFGDLFRYLSGQTVGDTISSLSYTDISQCQFLSKLFDNCRLRVDRFAIIKELIGKCQLHHHIECSNGIFLYSSFTSFAMLQSPHKAM